VELLFEVDGAEVRGPGSTCAVGVAEGVDGGGDVLWGTSGLNTEDGEEPGCEGEFYAGDFGGDCAGFWVMVGC
jgi:hypothetical protein